MVMIRCVLVCLVVYAFVVESFSALHKTRYYKPVPRSIEWFNVLLGVNDVESHYRIVI